MRSERVLAVGLSVAVVNNLAVRTDNLENHHPTPMGNAPSYGYVDVEKAALCDLEREPELAPRFDDFLRPD